MEHEQKMLNLSKKILNLLSDNEIPIEKIPDVLNMTFAYIIYKYMRPEGRDIIVDESSHKIKILIQILEKALGRNE